MGPRWRSSAASTGYSSRAAQLANAFYRLEGAVDGVVRQPSLLERGQVPLELGGTELVQRLKPGLLEEPHHLLLVPADGLRAPAQDAQVAKPLLDQVLQRDVPLLGDRPDRESLVNPCPPGKGLDRPAHHRSPDRLRAPPSGVRRTPHRYNGFGKVQRFCVVFGHLQSSIRLPGVPLAGTRIGQKTGP